MCAASEFALGVRRLLAIGSSVAIAPLVPSPPSASRVRALGPAEDAHEGLVRLLHLVELGGGRLGYGYGYG